MGKQRLPSWPFSPYLWQWGSHDAFCTEPFKNNLILIIFCRSSRSDIAGMLVTGAGDGGIIKGAVLGYSNSEV